MDMMPATVDAERWLHFAGECELKAKTIRDTLDINYNSPAQVKRYIQSLGFRVNSTGKEVLQGLKEQATDEQIEKIDLILGGRSYYKMSGTYGSKWLEKNVEDGSKVYPNWKIGGAAVTGRMACSNPNLQNIPAREFPIYREFFIPSDEDHVLIVSDVSQQEPRITAFLSRDPKLQWIFENDKDSHTAVAIELADLPEDYEMKKTDHRRRDAKAINLGLTYGLSAKGLAARTDKTVDEAKEMLDRYFNKFYGIKDYIQTYRRKAGRLGYVETILGKKCWVNHHHYRWQNNAINSPIQGSAAEMMKIALVVLHQMCQHYRVQYPVTMVIHDEMVLDVPRDKTETYQAMVLEAWRIAGERLIPGIPIKATATVAENWSEG